MQTVQHPFSLKHACQVASHTMFEQRCVGGVCPSDRFRDLRLGGSYEDAAAHFEKLTRDSTLAAFSVQPSQPAKADGATGGALAEASDAFKASRQVRAFRASVRLAWLSALLTVAIFAGVGFLFSYSEVLLWRVLSV